MPSKEYKVLIKVNEDKPIQKKKLPYVKPQLHKLELDNTEGKTATTVGEGS